MKLKVTIGEISSSMSIDGVIVAEYVSNPGMIVNIDTGTKVKLTEGRWVYWRTDDGAMPDKFDVYEGPWEARTKVGWCTRQHAAAVRKQRDELRTLRHIVKWHGRDLDIRVIGDNSAWYSEGQRVY